MQGIVLFPGRRQREQRQLPAVALRHVPKVLPDARRVGAPHSEHAHGVRAAIVEQEQQRALERPSAAPDQDGQIATINHANREQWRRRRRAHAEDLRGMQQKVPVARVHAHSQKDTYGREALHLRVLL